MARFFALICFSCMLMTGPVYSQSDPTAGIIESFRKGNSEELGNYFNDMVDLNIPGFRESYSKTQASRIIRDFFATRNVSSVSVSKQGDSPDGSKYTVGTMTAGGKKYSLYILLRKNKGVYKICQLQIQPE